MRLSDAIDAIMRQRGPRAAWSMHDACIRELHEDDHARFRREFNRIAGERNWPGRSYGSAGKRPDTRPAEWRPVEVDPNTRKEFESWQVAKHIGHLDAKIATLRKRLRVRADGWEVL